MHERIRARMQATNTNNSSSDGRSSDGRSRHGRVRAPRRARTQMHERVRTRAQKHRTPTATPAAATNAAGTVVCIRLPACMAARLPSCACVRIACLRVCAPPGLSACRPVCVDRASRRPANIRPAPCQTFGLSSHHFIRLSTVKQPMFTH